VRSVQATPFDTEILIVDDGSTDQTPEILERLTVDEEIRIFKLEKNTGKGAAVRTGIREATGDFVLIQDADLEYDSRENPKLLQPLQNGNET
jgi:glycosyltransferase involved in cell wall biosynthesis